MLLLFSRTEGFFSSPQTSLQIKESSFPSKNSVRLRRSRSKYRVLAPRIFAPRKINRVLAPRKINRSARYKCILLYLDVS